MAKLIDYDVKNGLIELLVSEHKNRFIITPVSNFEVFRYNEMADKFGHHYATENHDMGQSYIDIQGNAISHEEMQRFVDYIIVDNTIKNAKAAPRNPQNRNGSN